MKNGSRWLDRAHPTSATCTKVNTTQKRFTTKAHTHHISISPVLNIYYPYRMLFFLVTLMSSLFLSKRASRVVSKLLLLSPPYHPRNTKTYSKRDTPAHTHIHLTTHTSFDQILLTQYTCAMRDSCLPLFTSFNASQQQQQTCGQAAHLNLPPPVCLKSTLYTQ